MTDQRVDGANADSMRDPYVYCVFTLWRESDTFRELRDSFSDVVAPGQAVAFADAAIDLARASSMGDAELVAVPRVGAATVARLRQSLASRALTSVAAKLDPTYDRSEYTR